MPKIIKYETGMITNDSQILFSRSLPEVEKAFNLLKEVFEAGQGGEFNNFAEWANQSLVTGIDYRTKKQTTTLKGDVILMSIKNCLK